MRTKSSPAVGKAMLAIDIACQPRNIGIIAQNATDPGALLHVVCLHQDLQALPQDTTVPSN